MAKKREKEENSEPVTKRDQSMELVANSSQSEAAKPSGDHLEEVDANCDHPEKGEVALSQHDIEKLIITVRGEQVLIDQDIARLYGVTTKRLNEQAKRNSARFPSNFRFELTEEERDEVVANCDHLQSLKFRPTLPYAFTEQGIGQLSSVVHSQQAIERSIVIMNAFVAMRRFIVQNAGILMRLAHLERHQIETDEKIDLILDKMEERSPKLLPEQIFQTGCVWDAWSYVSDLEDQGDRYLILGRNQLPVPPIPDSRGERNGHPWWNPKGDLHQRERPLCAGATVEAATGEGVQAVGDLRGAAADPNWVNRGNVIQYSVFSFKKRATSSA